jgi:hypothetical protein
MGQKYNITNQQISLKCLAGGYSFENLKGPRLSNRKKTAPAAYDKKCGFSISTRAPAAKI